MFELLYILTCIFWACFAIKMQKKVYPDNSSIGKLLIVFLANMVICPIAIVITYFRDTSTIYNN